MGGEERSDGVGKWVDSVVNVERYSKRLLIFKMVLDNGLLDIFMVYAPPQRRKKRVFGMKFSI